MEDVYTIHWHYCLICQQESSTKTVTPTEIGFKSFVDLLKKWKDIHTLPAQMSTNQVDQLITILPATYMDKNAFSHKTCYNKCDKQKYERKFSTIIDIGAEPPAKKASLEVIKEEADIAQPSVPSIKRATRSNIDGKKKGALCFFCENAEGEMHLTATKELDAKVRHHASRLSDHKFLIKLAEGDMTAIDATYHLQCLVNLYNRVRQKTVKRLLTQT